ncbi:MAG TPA: DNA mismatch repair protein MutT, partial [Streptosporangiaceae bacterium]
GVFSTPDHVIAYYKGDRLREARQPVNICLHAQPVGGEVHRTAEAAEAAWVAPDALERYEIHPAIRLRIQHGLSSTEPYLG